jgi:hypothetical protein
MSKNKLHVPLIAAMTVFFVVALGAVALADNVQNDVVAGGNDTFVEGGSSTVNYRIAANSGDGETGCNATTSSPATVTIILPAGVTATPGSLSFTSCSTDKSVVFGSSTPGDYEITASVSDTGAGSYNTNPAKFTLHVLTAPPPSDTTPPVITPTVVGTLGDNGWYVSDVTVSWLVEDGESAISSSTGCDPTTINADTAGTTLTCEATSAGGTSSQSVTIKRDATAPTILGSASPAANTNGWNNTDVTVSFTCGDNLSGVASCGPNTTLTSEGAGQSASGNAMDNAGNSASTTVSGIDIDKTDPTASGSAAPAANSNGWNNTDVTVSFSGSDGLSGVDFCSAPVTLSAEAAGQSASGTCTDKAGNVSATATASGINIDKTAPDVSLVGGPQEGQSYYFGSVPAAPTCSASDTLSGIDGSCTISGYGTVVGTHTVTANAGDLAGNSASATATYTVLAWTLNGFYAPVDMNGVWNTIKGGSTVPLKFDVFAGPTELTDPSVVDSFTVKGVACPVTGIVTDDIEMTTTGSTTLRYDDVAGQFIQNWQTPKKPGACYQVTMKTDDGSAFSALFKLK